jgi:uncharacterized protein
MRFAERHPWIPYVVPFAVFMALLPIDSALSLPPKLEALVRVAVPALALLVFSRHLVSFRMTRPVATIGVGVLVFVLWIAPDELVPGWRSSVLFENGVVGRGGSSVPPEARSDPVFLGLRALRGILIVPVVEELFWRGWLPRWVDRMDDFTARPLGAFTALSFGATAVLFALEHGSFWDVGLVAGVIYNWWIAKTRHLGDLIACHAVTNGCLALWVLATGQWSFW